MRTTKGGADFQQATSTATTLFDGKLESDSSASPEEKNERHSFAVPNTILLDEEVELVIKGLNEAQRKIWLGVYVDYMQNHMSMEEINEKYHSDGLDVGLEWYYNCCKYAENARRMCNWNFFTGYCKHKFGGHCVWVGGPVINDTCCPDNWVGKKSHGAWDECK